MSEARVPGPQRGDGQHPAAIFVAQRKAEQQVFDGVETDAGEVGRALLAHPLQELERRIERIFADGLRHSEPSVSIHVGNGTRGCEPP